MAEASGGHVFREESVTELPDLLEEHNETVKTPVEIDIWSSPLFFILLIGLMTAEWTLRKLSGLL